MIRVHTLMEGFMTPNGRGFLFPIYFNKERLRSIGVRFRPFNRVRPELYDCDVLVIDSKHYRDRWAEQADQILEELDAFKNQIKAVLWFDTADSAGSIQGPVFPFVKLYYKGQVFRDRSLYSKAYYGNRIYTDYYHRTAGVVDRQPEYSAAVSDPEALDKFRVSWNSGLADYSLYYHYLNYIYLRVPLPFLLRYLGRSVLPSEPRPLDVSCRMGINYSRDTVAHQRREMRERLSQYVRTDKLSRRAFFKEMAQSKVIVSPFGLGEITLKDFEIFICGGLMLKPDMSHMETFPDFFQPGITMVSHKWNLSDLESKIEEILSNDELRIQIATAGQELYRKHVATEEGHQIFSERFKKIVQSALS